MLLRAALLLLMTSMTPEGRNSISTPQEEPQPLMTNGNGNGEDNVEKCQNRYFLILVWVLSSAE